MTEKFGEKYFVGGKDSNYSDYRGKRFDQLATDLIEELPIRPMDKVCDIGCATGGLLNSLKRQGVHNVRGTDISIWAISYGRETFGFSSEELQYYSLNLLSQPKDWVIALDVFEHCPQGELERILEMVNKSVPKKGMVVRIPVSINEGEDFALDVSKHDRTHIQIHSKSVWCNLFKGFGYEQTGIILGRPAIYDSSGVYCAKFKHRDSPVDVRI